MSDVASYLAAASGERKQDASTGADAIRPSRILTTAILSARRGHGITGAAIRARHLAIAEHSAFAGRRNSGAGHGCAHSRSDSPFQDPRFPLLDYGARHGWQAHGIRDQRAQSGARRGEERRDLAAQDSSRSGIRVRD